MQHYLDILNNAQALNSRKSPEATMAAMKDDSRSLSVIAMKWWISWREKETSRCLSKSCARGWELSFSILSTKPVCLVLKVISCLCCSVFFFFVLPLPPSRILWPWPLLHTAAPFNLPNAVMGQANQPPERHWDPAKHFQLWHMWAHLVKCHDNIKQSDIPASQSVSRHRI